MQKTNIIGAILFIALFAAAYAGAAEFPEEVALYPKLSCVFGIILGIVLIIKSYFSLKKEKETGDSSVGFSYRKFFIVAVTLMGTLIYVMSLDYLGYIIATSAFIMIFSFLFDSSTKKWLYPVVGVAITLVIYLLFSTALHIPLPQGLLF